MMSSLGKRAKLDGPRPMDFSKYTMQKVALKIAYDGGAYKGMATQQTMPITEVAREGQSVEDSLFRAVLKLRLIDAIRKEDFSRCGRTDTGVSANGQVVCLRLRGGRKDTTEVLSYGRLLNGALPDDIRVLGWSVVSESFNARFDCQWRQYRYFFARKRMDIEAMQRAAKKLVGQHDFRNLCVADPSKGVKGKDYSTLRNIMSVSIEALEQDKSSPTTMYELVIRGTAFLYHQVRCIMGALFVIGQGRQPPEWINALFDIKSPKPAYEMANETGLVLDDCGYPMGVLLWQQDGMLDNNFLMRYERHAAKAQMLSRLIDNK